MATRKKPPSSEEPVTEAAGTVESPAEEQKNDDKPKKPRNVVPKRINTLILDPARSTIKFLVIDADGNVIECPKLPSVIALMDNPLHQEEGAYTLGLKPEIVEAALKDEAEGKKKPKDEVLHYVVGHRAKIELSPIAMTDSHNNKFKYFYLLAMGAIASIPNLYELSTGTTEKSRTLTLRMVILSLADGKALLDQLKRCRWIKVNGVKYNLNFLLNHSLYFSEGYGASVWAQNHITLGDGKTYTRSNCKDISIFDVGFGTACSTPYNCAGRLPLKRAISINGGGGLGALIDFTLESMAREMDSSRRISLSEVRQIIEDSTLDEKGKIIATSNDGRDVGSALEKAIRLWMTDSVLKFALQDISLEARRNPVVLTGGSFAIAPIRERIKQRLLDGGAKEEFLIDAPDPGMLAVAGMAALFINQKQPETKQSGTTSKTTAELHSTHGVINSNQSDHPTTGDITDVLDTQTA